MMTQLLFKEQGFSEDYKKIVGIVDSNFSWEKIRPSLILASDEIRELIGELNYLSLLADPLPVPLTEFYELTRFVVAFRAYIIYAPTGDLQLTNKGRLMRRDEYEVSAFEWQLSTHDRSLRSFYYRQLNMLLKFMIRNGMLINLDKYRHDHLIVPSLAEFEKHYGLNDSFYLYLNLLPAIKDFEDNELLPRVGAALFLDRPAMKLEPAIYGNAQKAAVYYAIAWGLRHLDIQMFPESVVRSTGVSSSKNSASSTLVPAELALVFEQDYEKYILKLEKAVTALKMPLISQLPFTLPDLDFSEDDQFVST